MSCEPQRGKFNTFIARMKVKFKMLCFNLFPVFSMLLVACSKETSEKADKAFSIGSSIAGILSAIGTGAAWIIGIVILVVIVIMAGKD